MSIRGVAFVFVEGSLALEADGMVFVADAGGANDVEWLGQVGTPGPTANERLADPTANWVRVSYYESEGR